MCYLQQGQHTLLQAKDILSWESTQFIHFSNIDVNRINFSLHDIYIKLSCYHISNLFMRIFETRNCTPTKDLVCSMITISDNATPMTTME